MIISFNGAEGSGKSGIGKRLATTLGWPYYDIGKLRRQMAEEKGMTLEEYNKLGETDSSTDVEVDNYQATLGRQQDNFVIGGRTSWHFIPQSLKIFLFVELEIGAERIFKDSSRRNEAKNIETVNDVIETLRRRVKSDDYRYKKYFSIDVYDRSNYDWFLDTSHLTEEEVFQQVYEFVQEKIKVTAE